MIRGVLLVVSHPLNLGRELRESWPRPYDGRSSQRRNVRIATQPLKIAVRRFSTEQSTRKRYEIKMKGIVDWEDSRINEGELFLLDQES